MTAEVAAILDQWREAGVELNGGATDVRLRRLELALGVPLPADVRAYFSDADGMQEEQLGADLSTFWSIEKILRERLEREGRDAQSSYRELAFADVLIGSWHFWFRVREGGHVSVFVEGAGEEYPSLVAALERYLAVRRGHDW